MQFRRQMVKVAAAAVVYVSMCAASVAETPPIDEAGNINAQVVDEQGRFDCSDTAKQGGLILCQAPAGAEVKMDGAPVAIAAGNGLAAIGLSRAAPAEVTLNWSLDGQTGEPVTVAVASRKDIFRELTGLECDKVDARTEAQKAHAGQSWVLKVDAFKTLSEAVDEDIAFAKPVTAPFSSPFGPTRHYTGVSAKTGKRCEKTSVHQGLDMATPVGTELRAPMGGTVTLADTDLYYEGGAIFLDHGYGLVSVFMHLSEVDVSPGDIVAAGDRLGATGNTGRTTGPHLHWAVKWQNLTQSSRDGDFYIDPAILLELNAF